MANHVILMPLAGKGQRFKNAGYALPKPLIPVSGVPMVIQATRMLPRAEEHVFVCHEDRVRDFQIDAILKAHFPLAHIAVESGALRGQAASCLVGEPYIDPDTALTIGACDMGVRWSGAAFKEFLNDDSADALIWTFRHAPALARNPEAYGWVGVRAGGITATHVQVKMPLSENPVNDHAIVGIFSFKKARVFFECAKEMIRAERRIKNEFYVDECMNVVIEKGYRVRVFEVDTVLCWGTPDDLNTYEYWRAHFQKH